jgi:hypothetical protein
MVLNLLPGAGGNEPDTRDVLLAPYRARPLWALLHDAAAHPLLALTGCAAWACRFHEWTSAKSYEARAEKKR